VCVWGLDVWTAHVLAKISGCSPLSRPIMLGPAASQDYRLISREVIFEEFRTITVALSVKVRKCSDRCRRFPIYHSHLTPIF